MTVFCSLFSDVKNGEEPILISDVLLTTSVRQSTDGSRYVRTYIPSVGGTFPQVSSDASIAGIVQKISVTESGACFAVAGDLRTALELHSALGSSPEILKIPSVYTKFKGALQFVILVPDRANSLNYVCATDNCKLMRSTSYGMVIIGGSGESVLRRILLGQADRPIDGDSLMMPMARALCLVNEALNMDETDPDLTLAAGFGAYYEIASYEDGRYAKVDNVSHHYLRFIDNGERSYWQLTKSYFHEYHGDDLIVRRVAVSFEDPEPTLWQDCYVVGGFNKPLDKVAATAHINSKVPTPLWEVVAVEIAGCVFRAVSNERQLVEWSAKDGRWHFSIDEERLGEVFNEFLAAMG